MSEPESLEKRVEDLERVVLALLADREEPTLEQQHRERVARLRGKEASGGKSLRA
jgi:hypothetical protein